MASSSSPSITSPGIGSGLDVTTLVGAIMSAEQVPLTALKQKNTADQAKISAFGTVKSNLSNFQNTLKKLSDPTAIQSISTNVADASVLSASGGRSATPGSYNVEVKQLAQAQKLAAAGQTDTNATIGSGVITFDFGTMTANSFTSNGLGAKTVTIDADHQNLSGIRDAINAANIGVTATIINDGSTNPYRLTLTNSQTGLTQSMNISVGPLDSNGTTNTNLANLLTQTASTRSLTETVPPQNAIAVIDGITVSKATNTMSDVISGVSLTLKKTNIGSPTTVSVARDTQTLTSNLNNFVSGFNSITASLKSLSSYDLTNKKGAALYGESS
jgi:flagellar hook-associated protein 2